MSSETSSLSSTNLPDPLLSVHPTTKAYLFWNIRITDLRDGTFWEVENMCYCETYEEAIKLTRLTWMNEKLWGVSLAGQSIHVEQEFNPFKQSLESQTNPFMQSFLT